jgi:hypothetical protein
VNKEIEVDQCSLQENMYNRGLNDYDEAFEEELRLKMENPEYSSPL